MSRSSSVLTNAAARKSDRRIGDVVVFERLQFPTRRVLTGQSLVGRGVDLVEVSRADELLQQRDMRVMRGVQSKALRISLEQAGIVGFGMLDHRRVRLQRNVDGRNW